MLDGGDCETIPTYPNNTNEIAMTITPRDKVRDAFNELRAAIASIAAPVERQEAAAAPDRASWVVSAKTLSSMFEPLAGLEPSSEGYRYRVGWNDALRRAMDYTMPPPESPKEAEAAAGQGEMRPTYYVRHPDGSISIAVPQPTPEQIAAQADYIYAQCDRKHGGGVCEDPDCHVSRASLPASPSQGQPATVDQLLAEMRSLAEATKLSPGRAVPVPTLVAVEGRKFMRGEPSLFDRVPLGDAAAVTSTLETIAAPSQPSQGDA